MDPSRWQQVRELYHTALNCAAEDRAAYLNSAAGDDAVRAEVASLLDQAGRAESFLEPPSSVVAAAILDATDFRADGLLGRRVAGYDVRGILGRGGFGVVYEAEQHEPRRPVALKIIRGGAALNEHRVRLFRREAQALARLLHPCISTIYESGRTDDGEPYFAMELVRGKPLSQYVRNAKLSISQRLSLFVQICDAIAYAHQKGVTHRDLKPDNILVATDGNPKILDFGLAKIVDSDLAVTTILTSSQIAGTLPYMSPEQARGSTEDIDTRSDVYSLGVILFDLLTYQKPYTLSSALPESVRIICEQPPMRPSTFVPSLRGDLDTIILKTLEKEPARRYSSAAALSDDIRRYMGNQPVMARPPSTLYQIRKLIARHRLPFLLVVGLLAVIGCSAVVTGWLAIRYAQQRDLAQDARNSTEQFAGFLERLFEEARITQRNNTREPSIRHVLDKGYDRLDGVEDPLAKARLMAVMGNVYADLDQLRRSHELLQGAVAIRKDLLGSQHPDTAASLIDYSHILHRMLRFDEADAVASEAISALVSTLGDTHPKVADAWEERASDRYYAGDSAHAVEFFQKALEIDRLHFGTPSSEIAQDLKNLGQAYLSLNKLEEAELCLKESLEMRQQLGNLPLVLLSMDSLAQLAWRKGNRRESEELYAEELRLARTVYEPNHTKLSWILSNYAHVVEQNQGPTQAEPLYRESVQIIRAAGADGHRDLARCLKMLGANLLDQSKLDQACELLQEAADIYKKLLGPDEKATIDTLSLLNKARSQAESKDE